jgi:RNA polymerase sigma-70 factor (family 1)
MSASHPFDDINSQGVTRDTEDAFEQMFKTYFRKLAHFAYQLVKEESVAKDVAQDAFVTYWNNRNEVSSHEKAIRNFLYTTVRNNCLNILRHNKVVNQYRGTQDPEPVDDFDIMHALVRSEVVTEIYAAIETLPESCRRISRMGYLDGLKNTEIADALGVSVNTVKTQKKRGLQLLRLRLDPRYLFFFFFSGL